MRSSEAAFFLFIFHCYFSTAISEEGLCEIENGGCSQICYAIDTQIQCGCFRGYELQRDNATCKDINECEQNPDLCEFKCVNKLGSYSCDCPSGYRLAPDKKSCQDIDECLANNGHGPCNDVCKNELGGYTCSCDIPGTELSSDNHTCLDVDECAVDNFNCSHTCLNTLSSAFCICPEGFSLGPDWKTCLDIDECEDEELSSNCKEICLNTIGSYKCIWSDEDTSEISSGDDISELSDENNSELIITNTVVKSCPEGYGIHANGSCYDINECELGNYNCTGLCVNIEGSAYCQCSTDMILDDDNKTCIPKKIDYCQINNNGCSHLCVNEDGEAHCECPADMILTYDNKTCIEKNMCKFNNGGCSQNCNYINGRAICSCNRGYQKDRRNSSNCLDINECIFRNGGCNQDCINFEGGHYCICSDHFVLDVDGKTCIPKTCPPIRTSPFVRIECIDYHRKSNIFPPGAICKIKCQKGYKLVGNKTLTCRENGDWSSSFQCIPMSNSCPILEPISNGKILPSTCGTGKTYWDRHCYYTCNPGFKLIGSPIRSCKRTIGWIPHFAPYCQKVSPVKNCHFYRNSWICIGVYSSKSWVH